MTLCQLMSSQVWGHLGLKHKPGSGGMSKFWGHAGSGNQEIKLKTGSSNKPGPEARGQAESGQRVSQVRKPGDQAETEVKAQATGKSKVV